VAVRIVTDSTAGLRPESAAAQRITVIPIGVSWGATNGREGVDIGPSDVLQALRDRRKVSTSQPPPLAFVEAYAGPAMAEPGTDIVSIHLSGELSGTVAAAELAAQYAAGRVVVVDSRLVSAGLAFVVEAAVAAANSGADAEQVAEAARQAAAATSVFFCVEDLNALKAGGRIGPASARLGTALAVKPILRLKDGEIVTDSFVRTTRRAMERLCELAGKTPRPARAAVVHLGAPERAAQLAGMVSEVLGGQDVPVGEVSAAIAAHTGEGVLGVAVMSDAPVA